MNETPPNDRESLELQMIEYHLGLMPADQREHFARRLETDAGLQRQYEQLVGALDGLDEYDVPVPEDLAVRILSAARTHRVVSEQLEPGEVAGERTGRLTIPFVFRELAAAAAAIILVVSTWTVTSQHARQQSFKALCASNLGGVGTALAAYVNDHPYQLPQAATADENYWYDPGRRHPKRQHLFITVKLKYVEPGWLVCPASKAAKGGEIPPLDKLDDFPPSMPVTYSFQNLYGEQRFSERQRRLRWRFPNQMAIMADQTPLFKGNELIMILRPMTQSRNHSGFWQVGQNVLFLDGSVAWKQEPLVGLNEDNIWQAGQMNTYTGAEVATDPTDSFLAP